MLQAAHALVVWLLMAMAALMRRCAEAYDHLDIGHDHLVIMHSLEGSREGGDVPECLSQIAMSCGDVSLCSVGIYKCSRNILRLPQGRARARGGGGVVTDLSVAPEALLLE